MRIGSLFSGAGGLDLAALELFDGAGMAWHCEVDPAASKVLAHQWPDVPNLGDVERVGLAYTDDEWAQIKKRQALAAERGETFEMPKPDWSAVEPVDILTGGFPCQDVSLAGLRAGMSAGTRSGLWSHMAAAIAALRPRIVLIENVKGLLSAEAVRDVESGAGPMGDGGGRPVLRALGAVLGALAGLGFDADWMCVRASDVGACHRRERVFILAYPAGSGPGRFGATSAAAGPVGGVTDLLPTPMVTDSKSPGPGDMRRNSPQLRAVARLLPTPRASDGTKGGPNQRGSAGDLMLPSAVTRLLATPRASDGSGGPNPLSRPERQDDVETRVLRMADAWGPYEAAIRRQESLSHPAPSPTEANSHGNQRLSPSFAEWMMWWPKGWVTDPAIGLSRNDQLKICGNGVVPRQAVAAFRALLEASTSPVGGAA